MPWLAKLGSMRLTLALLAALVAACVAGTLRPQADVFHAWWFLALAGALAASLLLCAARQTLALRGGARHGAAAGRGVASLLLHAGLLAILAGAAVRGLAGTRGTLQLHVGETAAAFDDGGASQPLPFSVTLLRFAVETESAGAADVAAPGSLVVSWPGAAATVTVPAAIGKAQTVAPPGAGGGATRAASLRVLRYEPDFVLDPATRAAGSQSDAPRNPAVQVEITAPDYAATNWLFARYPGFSMPMRAAAAPPLQLVYTGPASAGGGRPPVRNYRSTVALAENGRTVLQGDVAVNAPLAWRGYALYQASYNPRDPDWTALLVVRDPGVPVVYAGFTLVLAGLFPLLFVWPKEGAA